MKVTKTTLHPPPLTIELTGEEAILLHLLFGSLGITNTCALQAGGLTHHKEIKALTDALYFAMTKHIHLED